MRKSASQNFQLGIFVVVGLALFVTAIYMMGNRQNMFGNNIKIVSVFKNVNGLQSGNNVRFAGVNVGTVRGITIASDTAIYVDMFIHEKNARLIRNNALAAISSDGLVGSMIVNLIPGDDALGAFIQDGDTIFSISKIATADMLTTLNTTNENAALLTQDLLKITNAINKGEGLLGALIKDQSMVDDIKQTLVNLKETSRETTKAMHEINAIIAQVDMDHSLAGKLLNDTITANKLTTLLDNLNTSAEEIETLTKNLNAFTEEVRTAEGPLHFMLNDSIFVENLDSTMRNVEEASEKFNENMEALKHNFLFRGYFRKLERQKAKEERKANRN